MYSRGGSIQDGAVALCRAGGTPLTPRPDAPNAERGPPGLRDAPGVGDRAQTGRNKESPAGTGTGLSEAGAGGGPARRPMQRRRRYEYTKRQLPSLRPA